MCYSRICKNEDYLGNCTKEPFKEDCPDFENILFEEEFRNLINKYKSTTCKD